MRGKIAALLLFVASTVGTMANAKEYTVTLQGKGTGEVLLDAQFGMPELNAGQGAFDVTLQYVFSDPVATGEYNLPYSAPAKMKLAFGYQGHSYEAVYDSWFRPSLYPGPQGYTVIGEGFGMAGPNDTNMVFFMHMYVPANSINPSNMLQDRSIKTLSNRSYFEMQYQAIRPQTGEQYATSWAYIDFTETTYTVSSVPEPGAVMMLVAGIPAVMVAARRRRRHV